MRWEHFVDGLGHGVDAQPSKGVPGASGFSDVHNGKVLRASTDSLGKRPGKEKPRKKSASGA